MSRLQVVLLVGGVLVALGLLVAGWAWGLRGGGAAAVGEVELVMSDPPVVRAAAPLSGVRLSIDGVVRCEWAELAPGDHAVPEGVARSIASAWASGQAVQVRVDAVCAGAPTFFSVRLSRRSSIGSRSMLTVRPAGEE